MVQALEGLKTPMTGRSVGRLVLAGFLAWTLFLQAFVTESHIHNDSDFAASFVSATADLGHKNVPNKDDPAKCPICQQIGRAGQYVTPSWLAPFLLIQSISAAQITIFEISRVNSVSHIWRGRGPPLN